VTAVLPARPETPTRGRARRVRPPVSPSVAVLSTALGLVALLLLAFVAEVAVVGAVRHARAQALGFATLRSELAEGITPIGQTDSDGNVVASGHPIALLEIPELGVREVVRQGSTSSVLAAGPGHRRDTPYPGQAGGSLILGRQAGYGGPFAHLDDLSRGDTIVVTTGQGVQTFTVTGLRHAGDPAFALAAGESRLTLISATGPHFLPSGTVRVDAELTSTPVAAPPFVFGASALAPAEQAMAGDRSSALALYLWAQLLLLAGVALVWMRSVWGRWQTWVVAVPVLALAGLQVAHQFAMFLPNLL